MDAMRVHASFPTEGHTNDTISSILTALSEAAQVDVADLQPPMNDVIDSDALEQLLASADERLSERFPCEGWEVKVHGNGPVEVTKNPETR